MRRACLFVALHTLPACFVPLEVGRQMQADITAIKGELASLRHGQEENRAIALEQTQQTLAKVEQLSHAVQDMGQSSRMSDADFNSQMEHMIRDVQELRGAVEVNEHRLGETEVKLDKTLATRITAMGQAAPEAPSPTAATPSAAQAKAPKNRRELLAYGLGLFKDNKVDDARGVLRDLIKQYPKETGLTDAALWRLAESYFDDKRYDEALREYVKIVDKFTGGNFVEGSYYKIALCSAEAGHLDDAQTFLTELVTNHKASSYFKRAQNKLAEINKRLEAKRLHPQKKGRP